MKKRSSLIHVLLLLLANLSYGAITYVTQTGAGAKTGADWANAMAASQLKPAIDGAAVGTDFWVATGTYYPGSSGDRAARFNLRTGVGIYGGFSGTETNFNDRNLTLYPTVLSGDLDQSGTIDDNDSYSVVYSEEANQTAIFDGFIVRGGNANGEDITNLFGGGIYVSMFYTSSNSPIIRNCIVENNNGGVGVSNLFGSTNCAPIFTNIIIRNNTSFALTVYNYYAPEHPVQPVFNNVLIYGNSDWALSTSGSCQISFNNITVGNNYSTQITTIDNRADYPIVVNNSIITSVAFGGSYTGNNNIASLGITGSNNINVDPQFYNAAAGNYHLAPCSPAINAGSNAAVPGYAPTDVEGNARIVNTTVDIGAYEFQADTVAPVINNCPGNIATSCGSIVSWTAPSVSDAGSCAPPSLISNYAPGVSFPNGVTTVTYTATDAANNTGSCSFTVTVTPVPLAIAPPNSGICPGNSITLTATAGALSYKWNVAGGTSILDNIPSTKLAVGLKKLRTAYNGPALQLRRSSDNAVQNIGFVNNALDVSAVTSFLNGSAGYVKTMYDQSGQGNDVVQNNNGNQPLLVLNGQNGKPVIRFNTSQYMDNNADFSSTPFTVVYAARQNGPARARVLSSTNNNWLLGWWGGSKGRAYFEGWVAEGTNGGIWFHVYSGTYNGTVAKIYENGVIINTANINNLKGPNGLRLNGSGLFNEPSDCDFTEVILTNTVLSDFDRALIEEELLVDYAIADGSVFSNQITVSPITTTSYSVTAEFAGGCISSAQATVTVYTPPTPHITGNLIYCKNSTTTLDAGAGYSSYLWSTGATSQTIEADTPGKYVVTVTDANGCMGKDSVTVSQQAVVPINLSNFEVNGSAVSLGGSCFRVTENRQVGQIGSIWYRDSIDLDADFDLNFNIQQYFTEEAGEGMVFVMQRFGIHALGNAAGATIGYYGNRQMFGKSLGVEMDLNYSGDGAPYYDDFVSSHISIVKNDTALPLAVMVGLDLPHSLTYIPFRITWNHTTHLLNVYQNGNLKSSYTDDLINNVFDGHSKVLIGFTGSTSQAYARQDVCVTSLDYNEQLEIKRACGSATLSTNAAPGASFSWSTGATTPTIEAVAGNTYQVTATVNGCSKTASMYVTATTVPTITPSGPLMNECPGSLTLTASAGQSFGWSNGSTTQSMVAAVGGTYKAWVDGCTTAPVTITYRPKPVIAGTTSICPGYTTTLTAPAGTAYLWSTGATSQSILVNTQLKYAVTVTEADGCVNKSDSVQITIAPMPTVSLTVNSGTLKICESETSFIALYDNNYSSNPSSITYHWSSDSIRLLDNSNGYSAIAYPGTFTLTKSDPLGCSSSASVTTTNAPGDPNVYGNGMWNVYTFMDQNYFNGTHADAIPWIQYDDDGQIVYNYYRGYYTDSSLSFDTHTTYEDGSSPSSSPDFQGCEVYSYYSSWSAKRKGFAPGKYRIGIPDFGGYTAELYVNGLLAWSAPIGASNNAWTGSLNDTSKVEFRLASLGDLTQGVTKFTLLNQWTGSSNTDWSLNTNWSGDVLPTPGEDVTIPNTANKPALSADVTIGGINLQAGATLTIGSHLLTINGALTGTGTFTGSAISNLSINGALGTLNFTNGAQMLHHLNFGTNASATLGTPVTIVGGANPGTVALAAGASFASNGKLILQSDAGGTASVGQSAGIITGDVTVERFIPAGHRSWRLLTLPVSGTQTIRQAWANGTTPLPNAAAAASQTAGSGTLITGHGYMTAGQANSAGFDWIDLQNVASSVRTYSVNALGGSWPATGASTPALSTTTAAAAQGYMLFIRGDRKVVNGAPNSTTLRATNALKMGTRNYSIPSSAVAKYHLLGNPYASTIDFDDVMANTGNATAVKNDRFWVWDASNGTTGGYFLIKKLFGTWQKVPMPINDNSTNLQHIQSSQAVLVEPTAAGGPFVVNEEDKSAPGSLPPLFSVEALSRLYVNLNLDEGTSETHLSDGVLAAFAEGYADKATDADDVTKVDNFTENLSLARAGKNLSVEARPLIKRTDTLYLQMSNLRVRNYAFQIKAMEMPDGLTAVLLDDFLKTSTDIDLMHDALTYHFSVTSETASASAGRFKIVFKQNKTPINANHYQTPIISKLAQQPIASMSLFPNPATEGQVTLQFTNLVKGQYSIFIYNAYGQIVMTENMDYAGVDGNKILQLPGILAAGAYRISLGNGLEQTLIVSGRK